MGVCHHQDIRYGLLGVGLVKCLLGNVSLDSEPLERGAFHIFQRQYVCFAHMSCICGRLNKSTWNNIDIIDPAG